MKKKSIELKKVIIKRRVVSKTFALKDGLTLVYYGNKYAWEKKPVKGIIREVNGFFLIDWEDNQASTKINDSEHSSNILKYCGF